MRWPRSALQRSLVRIAGVTAVLFAAAAALGWKAGETPPPPPPAVGKEAWALQASTPDDPDHDLGILKARHPWTGIIDMTKRPPVNRVVPGAKPAAAAARPRPNWRLAGIVQRGDESFVLIATGNPRQTTYEYRRVGDSLPDGSILVQISADSAKTEIKPPASAASPESSPQAAAPETTVYRLFDKK